MITKTIKINGEEYIEYPDGRRCKKQYWYCRSTDEKPKKGVHNSEELLELDTFKVSVFDEEAQEWAAIKL